MNKFLIILMLSTLTELSLAGGGGSSCSEKDYVCKDFNGRTYEYRDCRGKTEEQYCGPGLLSRAQYIDYTNKLNSVDQEIANGVKKYQDEAAELKNKVDELSQEKEKNSEKIQTLTREIEELKKHLAMGYLLECKDKNSIIFQQDGSWKSDISVLIDVDCKEHFLDISFTRTCKIENLPEGLSKGDIIEALAQVDLISCVKEGRINYNQVIQEIELSRNAGNSNSVQSSQE